MNERNVLIINGSPHAVGPTARLIAPFLEVHPHATIFDCFARVPLPCDACGVCERENTCAKRDLDEYYTLLENADILVFAAPVYNLSFPAPMKALLDRAQRYWAARFVRGVRPPIPRPKKAYLLTAAGDSGSPGGGLMEQQLKPMLMILNAALSGSVHYTGSEQGAAIALFIEATRAFAEQSASE
ncbi:MAG: flavodoxin family protein [Oscillospiraceae bacterium]|nr:flavodoxin family protein [Oscillospiraceae bacterium]